MSTPLTYTLLNSWFVMDNGTAAHTVSHPFLLITCNPLSIMFATCLLGASIILIIPTRLFTIYGYISLFITIIVYAQSLLLWVFFDRHSLEMQFVEMYPILLSKNLQPYFGIDGLSLFFVLLTTMLFPLCILSCWTIKNRQYLFVNLISIELLLLLSFTSLDLFYFGVFFESIMLPMFFIILFWGVRSRRIYALTYFFMYTLIGSIFLFWALFLLYFETQTTSYLALWQLMNTEKSGLSPEKQQLIWLLLFITFAIKIPIFPFHIWLPEAHVEAPTVGSVVLAGLLLKLGGYGMIRFLFIFEHARYFFRPYVLMICVISIFYASYMALSQKDMKKIIAYSSIAHMNFALLGFFSNSIYGLVGGMCLMISHGFVSSALFFLIGMLYERYHDRALEHYSGLVQIMPVFINFFFAFSISNFSFPLTSNFIGEFLVLTGLALSSHTFILILAAISTFFGLAYSMLLFNKLAFGQLKLPNYEKYTDLSRLEVYYISPLLQINFLFGFFPTIVLTTLFFTFQKYVLDRNSNVDISEFQNIIAMTLEDSKEELKMLSRLTQTYWVNTAMNQKNPEVVTKTLGKGIIPMFSTNIKIENINEGLTIEEQRVRKAVFDTYQAEMLIEAVRKDLPNWSKKSKEQLLEECKQSIINRPITEETPDAVARQALVDYLSMTLHFIVKYPNQAKSAFGGVPGYAEFFTTLLTSVGNGKILNEEHLYIIKKDIIKELISVSEKTNQLSKLAVFVDDGMMSLYYYIEWASKQEQLQIWQNLYQWGYGEKPVQATSTLSSQTIFNFWQHHQNILPAKDRTFVTSGELQNLVDINAGLTLEEQAIRQSVFDGYEAWWVIEGIGQDLPNWSKKSKEQLLEECKQSIAATANIVELPDALARKTVADYLYTTLHFIVKYPDKAEQAFVGVPGYAAFFKDFIKVLGKGKMLDEQTLYVSKQEAVRALLKAAEQNHQLTRLSQVVDDAMMSLYFYIEWSEQQKQLIGELFQWLQIKEPSVLNSTAHTSWAVQEFWKKTQVAMLHHPMDNWEVLKAALEKENINSILTDEDRARRLLINDAYQELLCQSLLHIKADDLKNMKWPSKTSVETLLSTPLDMTSDIGARQALIDYLYITLHFIVKYPDKAEQAFMGAPEYASFFKRLLKAIGNGYVIDENAIYYLKYGIVKHLLQIAEETNQIGQFALFVDQGMFSLYYHIIWDETWPLADLSKWSQQFITKEGPNTWILNKIVEIAI